MEMLQKGCVTAVARYCGTNIASIAELFGLAKTTVNKFDCSPINASNNTLMKIEVGLKNISGLTVEEINQLITPDITEEVQKRYDSYVIHGKTKGVSMPKVTERVKIETSMPDNIVEKVLEKNNLLLLPDGNLISIKESPTLMLHSLILDRIENTKDKVLLMLYNEMVKRGETNE